jgi:hypothetical protein
MRIYAKSPRKFPEAKPSPDGWDIVLVPSESNPARSYRVDVTHGRCNCPAWTHQKGDRWPCKHLKSLGFKYFIGGDVEVSQPKKAKVGQKVKVHS